MNRLIGWLSVLATLAVLYGNMGCGLLSNAPDDWKSVARDTLSGLSRTVVAAHNISQNACQSTVLQCIRDQTNPCPALDACNAHRLRVLKALYGTQSLLVMASMALELDDRPGFDAKVAEVLQALGLVRKTLRTLGVVD